MLDELKCAKTFVRLLKIFFIESKQKKNLLSRLKNSKYLLTLYSTTGFRLLFVGLLASLKLNKKAEIIFMSKLKSYLVAAALFAGLFAAWALANNFLAAQLAQAQSLSDKQWETSVVRGGSLPEGLQGVLNIRGEEGWELVDVVQSKDGTYVAFLKRRKR